MRWEVVSCRSQPRSSAKALVDALGPGVRIGRVLEEGLEPIDVFRWSVVSDERAIANFTVRLSGGAVLEHQLTP